MIEKLYGKYLMECSNNSILEVVAFELFKEKICDKLSDMNSIVIDNGVDEQGVLYYLRTPAWWCKHSAGHGALIPALWCTPSAKDGAPMPFPMVHGGRRLWCTAAMLGLYL